MKNLFFCIFWLFSYSLLRGAGFYPYEENKGQLGSFYQYRTILGKGVLYFHQAGYRVVLFHPDSFPSDIHSRVPTSLPYHVVDVEYLNARADSGYGIHRSEDYFNYFLGNDPTYWASRVYRYKQVHYQRLYSDIDLLWDVTGEGNLKNTWILYPGANPEQIKMVFKGGVRLFLHQDGKLEVMTSVGSFWELAPYAYQEKGQEKISVLCQFQLVNDSTVTFRLGAYDTTEVLYIDPTLVFSTFTGSYLDNWGFTATYDDQGNLYSGGLVSTLLANPPYTFPTTPGAYQTTYGGGQNTYSYSNDNLFYPSDIAIIKFNSTGTNRIWATLIGGSDNEQPHSIIANANQELYVLGATRSMDFPTTPNAFDPTFNGVIDIALVKISNDGTQLLTSTFVGAGGIDGVQKRTGNPLYHFYADDGRGEIDLDPYGNVWVVTSTLSNGLPTTPNALQNTLNGIQDGYIMKWDSTLTQLLYASYIGGSGLDALYNVEYDDLTQRVILVGGTTSPDLLTSPSALYPTFQGGPADGFIMAFDTAMNWLSATYFGSSDYDQIYHGEVSRTGYLYVAGQTLGNLTPTPGSNSNPQGNLFFAKMPLTLDTVYVLKRFGDSDPGMVELTYTAFLVDICGNVYFSGWGGLMGGSTAGLPITPDAIQFTTDGSDFYFGAFDSTLSQLKFASYFGGNGVDEHVDGGTSRFDPNGVIYQAICGGCGGSSAVPTTPGAWSNTNNSPNCNNVAVKIAFDLLTFAEAQASFSVIDSVQGCAPYTVQFQNTSTNADAFFWDFGDGNTSTLPNPVHDYINPGIYQVKLIAYSASNPCILPDSITLVIYVYQSKNPDFDFPVICDSLTVPFQNLTDSALTYLWDFGDGDTSHAENPVHTYAQPGYYHVSLVTNPGSICSDTITKVVTVPVTLPASFQLDTVPCVKDIQVSVLDTNYLTSATWIFDSNDTLQGVQLSYTFSTYGQHQVTLIRESFGYCSDTLQEVFRIDPPAIASFTVNVVDTCLGKILLTNTSQNADSFFWDLGDGTQLTTTSFAPISHQYQAYGSYPIVLIAEPGVSTCADTLVDTFLVPRHALASWDTSGEECSLDIWLSGQNSFGAFFQWYINGVAVSDSVEFLYHFPQSDTYQVMLIVFDSMQACSDTMMRELFVGNTSKAQFSVPDFLCSPTVRFLNESIYDTARATSPVFLWFLSDGSFYQDSVHLTHTFPDTGQYVVFLYVRPGTLCESVDSQRITIHYLPPPTFTIEKIPCEAKYQLINTSTVGDSAFWELDDGYVANSWHAETPFYPTGGMKHIVLHLFDRSQGCESVADTMFYYSPVDFSEVFIPNAFTPNGDGINDRFEIIGAEADCFTEMYIFDRWGNLIHQAYPPALWWDGTYQNRPAAEGVYVYLLRSERGFERAGTVTLLR